MRTIHTVFLVSLLTLATCACADDLRTGVAIAIVYDTSGSMGEPVANSNNQQEPKFQIAGQALKNIVGKIDHYAQTHPVEATLVTFQGSPVPFGKWDRAAFDTWLEGFATPEGGTPLGEAIATASKTLSTSKLARKHLVILTDGVSNGKLKPEAAIRDMKKRAGAGAPQVFVVAFDVNSQTFDALKKEGSTVLPASGKTLESGLKNLFSEKILLEDEEE